MSQRFSLYNDLTVEENITVLRRRVRPVRTRSWPTAAGRDRPAWRAWRERERASRGSFPADGNSGWPWDAPCCTGPGIVFLDEPTGGTDPLSRRLFWDIINELAMAGTTRARHHPLPGRGGVLQRRSCSCTAGGSSPREAPGALKREVITGLVFEVECADPVAAMAVLRGVPAVRETAIFGTLLHVAWTGRRRSAAALCRAARRGDLP